MWKLLRALFWWLARHASHVRYRVRLVGAEKLRGLCGPTLVMPNHPAYIDPPLVMAHLSRRGALRPVVTETMYRLPVFHWLMRLSGALEVPDLQAQSRDARQQTLAAIEAIVAGIQRGESFLLYPSGRAQRRGIEELGGARSAAEVLARCPQANVVLVRTRGLWGSSFSYARTGKSPRLGWCILRAAGWLVANLLFFSPRREVSMTVEVLDRSQLPGLDRKVLNRYLEEWYNREGSAAPVFVPYHHLFGPRQFEFPRPAGGATIDPSKVRPATIQAVNSLIEEHLGRPLTPQEQAAGTAMDKIGLDSLERMDIALTIEDRFGFHADQVAETLGELWALAEGMLTGTEGPALQVPAAWSRPSRWTAPAQILGETIPAAFLRRARQHPGDVAVADQVSGALTYRRMLVAVRLLARRFHALPGEAVGMLLPSSVAADVSFFALHLAGKLPVLLNWTTGPANLGHAVATLGIRHVITSRRLVDRLRIEVPGAQYVFLEDLRAGIAKFEAAMVLLRTYLRGGAAIAERHAPGPPLPTNLRSVPGEGQGVRGPHAETRPLPASPSPQPSPGGRGGSPDLSAPAVVLFTSGSESTPKAVPLSHRNLLVNCQGSIDVLRPLPGDSMLAVLPPFHSFGLLGNILAPILAGLRVVHHPDPTDAHGQVRMIAAYRTTFLITTPTFLGFLLAVATPDDLRWLRIVVTGAEKCPEAIFARVRELAPQATVIEGYGITECSPVVAGNRPDRARQGTVGQPLAGVEVLVVDPETRQPLPAGTTGLLLVRGPSVFSGYLNYQGPDPFVEVAGKRWYVTGDLVRLDGEGYIYFCGRLKRFLKAGGEMISLPALEEPLATRYPPTENGPQVAVEGVETPSGRCIVLFTTCDLSLREANALLSEAGFRGVMRLDEVVRLGAIPVLGTGKTDYKILRKQAAERAGT
jgi:long-chain-fatty-acid--[acyl-carrier-protein] ligase